MASTQFVELPLDLDFKKGFTEPAPIDAGPAYRIRFYVPLSSTTSLVF